MDRDTYDVVVVGGGAAGLSGALMLGRSRRRVLVVDAGEPRNAPAAEMHGFLGRDGTPPSDLVAAGREEVRRYGVELVAGTVVGASPSTTGDGFDVVLEDGSRCHARRLLVTTGLVDELPDVPGVRELWGHDVLHCPYCHGWEVRDQPIGVLASGPMSVHQALLFRQLSDDVVFFTHDLLPADDDRAKLEAIGVRIVDGKVTELEIVDGRLAGVRVEGDATVPRAAVAVAPRFVARALVLTTLGIEAVEHPTGVGIHVPCDPTGLTAMPGVWVAGNVTDPSATVIMAAAAGSKAGAAINADLAGEDAGRALDATRTAG
jgi:thioredoxin reductase